MDNEVSGRSDQILDLATQRRREKQVVDVEVEKTLLVIFQLGGLSPSKTASPETSGGLYGLPASSVESIVSVEEITYVPGTPPWILGVVNVRGEIESVLDLKAILGLGKAEIRPESRLLIAQDGELRSGLLVDQVVDIAEVSSATISPPPTPLEGGKGVYIAGETEYAGKAGDVGRAEDVGRAGDAGETLVLLDLSEIFHRALETDRV